MESLNLSDSLPQLLFVESLCRAELVFFNAGTTYLSYVFIHSYFHYELSKQKNGEVDNVYFAIGS